MLAKNTAWMLRAIGVANLVLAVTACVSTPGGTGYGSGSSIIRSSPNEEGQNYVLVDCLLPGQTRRSGTGSLYTAPRRAIKTSQRECAIRGGEYIVFDRTDYASALESLLPKAQGGDPIAQTYVGEIHEKGLGLVAPDYRKAAIWYRKAAEIGHRPAQTNLGALYEQGLGVPRNKSVALDWYRRASGIREDRLAFESALQAERNAFKQEIESRNRIAASLRQKLRTTQQALKRRSTEPSRGKAEGVSDTTEEQQKVEKPEDRIDEQQAELAIRENEAKALQSTYEQEKTALRRTYEQEKRALEGQRRDAESRADQLQKELHALRELKASETDRQQGQGSRGKSAQLGKLELSRKEQYEAIRDTSRRLAGLP